jgi:hypothetical protein
VKPRISNWYRQWLGLQRWEKCLLPLLVARLLCSAVVLQISSATRAIDTSNQSPAKRVRKLPPGIDESEFCARCEKLVSIAAFHGLCRPKCLPRALVLHGLLREYGMPSTLHIGVRQESAGQLLAHAWVECNAVVLGDHPDGFTTFGELPATRPGSAGSSTLHG